TTFGVRDLAPAFLFWSSQFSLCQSKATKIASFRIYQLRNESFVSPFFPYLSKLVGGRGYRTMFCRVRYAGRECPDGGKAGASSRTPKGSQFPQLPALPLSAPQGLSRL